MLTYRGFDVNKFDERARTTISHAAEFGNMGATTLLFQHGAGINMIGRWDCTPLSNAVAHGYTQVVQKLLTAGAQVGFRKESKTTIALSCSPQPAAITRWPRN
jgi:ankyrin repeat protein